MSKRKSEWLAIAFFAVLVALVFQQIATSMNEQGIASGGPYDNAASYPRSIAIFLGAMLLVQVITLLLKRPASPMTAGPRSAEQIRGTRRGATLLLVFGGYLLCLNWLGYHLSTAPIALIVMLLCGARFSTRLVLLSLTMAFGLAFAFEKILSVVLPGGAFGLNIPW